MYSDNEGSYFPSNNSLLLFLLLYGVSFVGVLKQAINLSGENLGVGRSFVEPYNPKLSDHFQWVQM